MLEPGWHPTGFLLGTGPGRTAQLRRRVGSRVAVVIGALVVALGAPVSVTAGSLVAGEQCAGAATGPTVAVVVDFGDVSGQGTPPGGVVSQCVPWSDGVTGLDALKSAGFTYRAQGAGQVCAINGYPADGCGTKTGDRKYQYWAYWKAPAGENSWDYSAIGAAPKIRSGGTEGWRFVEGAGSPNDPQPRGAADHDATCGPMTDPDSPNGPAVPGAGVPEANTPASPASSVATAPDSSTADAAVDDPAAPADFAPGTSTTATNAATPDVALAVATPASTKSDAGNILGVVIVVAVIVALGAAAFFRSRRPGTG